MGQKKPKKPTSIEQSSRKPLNVRYAEVLKLREAIAQTQNQLESLQRANAVREK